MAIFKKKNLLQRGKNVAAKVWDVYYGDDAKKAKRLNKIHIGKIIKDGNFNPGCGVISDGKHYRRNEAHAQVEKAKRSEFCYRCLRSPLNTGFVDNFNFEEETMVVEPGFHRPQDLEKDSIIPVLVGNESYGGGMNWSKKVHTATVEASCVKIACGPGWAKYHRGEFKIVKTAGWDDLCGNCGKYPERRIPVLRKLGLTCTAKQVDDGKAGKGLKMIVDKNDKDHYLVMPRMPKNDGGIKILSFTKAGLLDYLKSNPELVEKINNEIYVFVGQWTTPVIKYKKVVEEITL